MKRIKYKADHSTGMLVSKVFVSETGYFLQVFINPLNTVKICEAQTERVLQQVDAATLADAKRLAKEELIKLDVHFEQETRNHLTDADLQAYGMDIVK